MTRARQLTPIGATGLCTVAALIAVLQSLTEPLGVGPDPLTR
jgi:hypothetical protein